MVATLVKTALGLKVTEKVVLEPAPMISVPGFAEILNSDALRPVIVGFEIVNESEPEFLIVNVLVMVAKLISAGPKSVSSETEVTISPLGIDNPSPCTSISLGTPVP